MRVRLLGSHMCHKSHAIQFIICAPVLRTQKDLSCPAILQAKEVSYSLYIRFDCTQKLPFYLNRKGWLVGWLVGCKNRANYLYFCNHFPCSRTSPFQNLHPYLTANRGNCKGVKFLEGLGGLLGALPFNPVTPLSSPCTLSCKNSVHIFSLQDSPPL